MDAHLNFKKRGAGEKLNENFSFSFFSLIKKAVNYRFETNNSRGEGEFISFIKYYSSVADA